MAADPLPLIKALQEGVTSRNVACGIGEKPEAATTRWVVLWPDPGTVTDLTMRSRDGFDVVVTFHCYGESPEAALVALRRTRDAVTALARTVVGGRTVQVPEHSLARPLDRDAKADPTLWWLHDEWRFRTTP